MYKENTNEAGSECYELRYDLAEFFRLFDRINNKAFAGGHFGLCLDAEGRNITEGLRLQDQRLRSEQEAGMSVGILSGGSASRTGCRGAKLCAISDGVSADGWDPRRCTSLR